MKKCANCGKENIDKAVYCANCGVKLDSVSQNYSSSNSHSTSGPALSTLKKHLSEDSSSSSSAGSSVSNSNSNQVADKAPDKLKICCCYVPVILFILVLILAIFMNAFPESFSTTYEGDFKYLDVNGDEKLSFDEARQLDPYMRDKEIRPYFLEADKNNNGYLIGYEFDGFRSDVVYSDSYSYSSSDDSSSSNSGKYKYSSSSSSSKSYSSSSSGSSNSYNSYDEYDSSSEGYVLTCPYCGSEAIYETGGYYKCAECGNSIYDPDDLELAYQEGYMDLLAPVSLTIN